MHIGRRVRIRRADFDALLEASVVGHPQPTTASIWGGEVPQLLVPGEPSS
jgi:hypothetical protein